MGTNDPNFNLMVDEYSSVTSTSDTNQYQHSDIEIMENRTLYYFNYTLSSSSSATGNDLTKTLTNLFDNLIQPIITNLPPNLNPEVTSPVNTTIDTTIKLTLTFLDQNGNLISTVFDFPLSTVNELPYFRLGETTIGNGISQTLTPTSTSIAASFGLLLQKLYETIPKLNIQVASIGGGVA
jgi:hypothetical protein